MSDPEKTNQEPENATEAAIREALESVERIERERRAEDELSAEQVEVVSSSADEGDEEEIALDEGAAPRAGDNPMLAAMIQAKNEAVAALEQTQKEAKSLHERLLRVSADFENFKKRQTRERAEAVKFANEGILKELLPVLDNMERAISAARASTEQEGGKSGPLLEGVEMVHRQFMDVLGRFGIVGFSSVGERFDPARHEAVSLREDASVPNQTVLEEYQRGYLLHDRLVRPSMVIVSTGGPAAAAGDGESAETQTKADDQDEGAGA